MQLKNPLLHGSSAPQTWLRGRASRLLVAKDSQQYLTLLAQDADQILRLAGCFLFNRSFSKHHRFDIHIANFGIHFYDADAVEIQLDVLIVGERSFKAMRPLALQASISGASTFSEAAV